jgi:hypothetical protein
MMHHEKFYQQGIMGTCKGQAWGAGLALFCTNLMEVCEARMHGSDTKQMIEVEDFIMPAKVWLREFGGGISWSTRAQSHKEGWSTLEKIEGGRNSRPPRSVGLGQPAFPFHLPPGARLPQVSHSFICKFKFLSS